MSKKIVDLNNIARFASALDSRMKNKIAIEELRAKVEESNLSQGINDVRTMLGGKSLVYLTQAEYNDLSEGERNNEDIMYFITDAEDLSHVHDNLELLNSLDEEYFADLDSEINELTTNITNEIDRATEKENEIIAEVARVEGMLGGKSFVYLTQAEYDNLTEEERNDEDIIYFITDAGNASHEHANQEFLDSLNQEVFDNLNQDIDEVRTMLGGKALRYVTQAEYDELSEEEKNDEDVVYCITDAADISHEHANQEFLDGLNQEVIDAKQDKEDQNLLTENKTIVGAINELQILSEELDTDIFDLQAKAIELETYKADKEYVDNKLSTMDAITLNGYSIWVGTTEELEQIVERDPNTLYFEIDNDNDDQEEVETVQNISPVNNVLTLTTNKYQKTVIADETEIVFPQVTELTELHLYFDKNDNEETNLILPDDCKWRVDPNIEDASAYELIAIYNTSYWLVNIVSYSDDNTLSL